MATARLFMAWCSSMPRAAPRGRRRREPGWWTATSRLMLDPRPRGPGRPGREELAGGRQPGDAPLEHGQEAADLLEVRGVEHGQQVSQLPRVEVTEAIEQVHPGGRDADEDPAAVRRVRATSDQTPFDEAIDDAAHRREGHAQAGHQLGHVEVADREEVQHLRLGHRDVDFQELGCVGVGEAGEARLEVRDDLLDEDGALLLVDGMPLLAVLTVRSDRTIRPERYTDRRKSLETPHSTNTGGCILRPLRAGFPEQRGGGSFLRGPPARRPNTVACSCRMPMARPTSVVEVSDGVPIDAKIRGRGLGGRRRPSLECWCRAGWRGDRQRHARQSSRKVGRSAGSRARTTIPARRSPSAAECSRTGTPSRGTGSRRWRRVLALPATRTTASASN